MPVKARPKLYCFNRASHVGGADALFTHLLLLLHRDFDITVYPRH